MTISSTSNRKEFAGNGVTTAFASSPVIFYDDTDLTVYVVTDATGVSITKTLTTHYTVSGGDGSTGTVTMLVAPAAGETLVIVRTLPLTQTADFVNNDGSDAEVVERAYDKLTLVGQQLQAQIDRSFRLADSDVSGIDVELPDAATRSSQVMGFDADGGFALYDPLSAVSTSENVSFSHATTYGTGNVGRALQIFVNVKNAPYNATGDGVTDDTAAIQAALNASTGVIGAGKRVYFPAGIYLYDSLTIPDYTTLIGDGARATEIRKRSNAATITFGERTVVQDIGVNGNSKTGVALIIPAGKNYQRLVNIEARNCVSNVLTFAADAGAGFLALGCVLATSLTPGVGAAVKIASGTDSAAVPRRFIACDGAGSTLIDIAGMNNLHISNCRTEGVLSTAAASEVFMQGNRIGSNTGAIAATTFNSVSTGFFVGNSFATASVVLNNCASVHFDNEVPANNVTETGTATNDITIARTAYTPVWTSSGTQPAIVNGTISGQWWRQGKVIKGHLKFQVGSSDTFGTGTYSFSVPFTNAGGRDYIGVVRLLDSGTQFYSGVSLVASGASTLQIYFTGGAGGMSPTSPITLASGDLIHAEFEFNIY